MFKEDMAACDRKNQVLRTCKLGKTENGGQKKRGWEYEDGDHAVRGISTFDVDNRRNRRDLEIETFKGVRTGEGVWDDSVCESQTEQERN